MIKPGSENCGDCLSDGYLRCRCDNNFETGKYNTADKSHHVATSFSYVVITSTNKIFCEWIIAADTDFQAVREGGILFIDTLCEDKNIFKDFIRCPLYKKWKVCSCFKFALYFFQEWFYK